MSAPRREENEQLGGLAVLCRHVRLAGVGGDGWSRLSVAAGRRAKAKAVFLGDNYGEAAAVDVLGPVAPPAAISGNNQYFLWGSRGHDGSVVIRLGRTPRSLLTAYASVRAGGR